MEIVRNRSTPTRSSTATPNGKSKPSYLASRSFRNALFDVTDLLAATSESSDDPLQADAVKARVDETLSSHPQRRSSERR